MIAYAPGMIALPPPVADFVAHSLEGVGAIECAGLDHLALIPDGLVSVFHGAPSKPALTRARRECDIHADGRLRAVHHESHFLVGLDDLDARGFDRQGVWITIELAFVREVDHLLTDDPELHCVHDLSPGKLRHRQYDRVTQLFPRMHDEEEALTPEGVVSDDIGQRFGNLMVEELVSGGQFGHLAIPLHSHIECSLDPREGLHAASRSGRLKCG